jgi:hypothetical protein
VNDRLKEKLLASKRYEKPSDLRLRAVFVDFSKDNEKQAEDRMYRRGTKIDPMKNIMLAVAKKGDLFPTKVFTDWWKCGKWMDENLIKVKGVDPQQYAVYCIRGFCKTLYRIFFFNKFQK